MRPVHTMLLTCALTLLCIFVFNKQSNIPDIQAPPPEEPVEVQPIPQPEWKSHKVEKGEALSTILSKFNLLTNPIREAAIEIVDLVKLRPGHVFKFKFMPGEESPNEIHFALNEDNTLVIRKVENQWIAEKEEILYEVKRGYRQFVVESSLWAAAVSVGLRPSDIVEMAQVLQYDIDFNTEIRKGAKAELLVEEMYLDSKLVKLGSALILKFTNKDEEYMAIRYTRKAGDIEYYDSKGHSRRSVFLRSPLAFSKVTSKFNPKRFHPVLKKRRPHNGTDFGAPTGTSIRSVADGVVIHAGRNGGHGNFVKIKHQSPYHTSYSHLSKISVKNGQKIKQGQILGKVGSTGMSTGPHLHYQMWKNGKYVDAMRVQLPKSKKLSKSEMPAFTAESKKLIAEMGELLLEE